MLNQPVPRNRWRAALPLALLAIAAGACDRAPADGPAPEPGIAPPQHATPPALTEVQVYFTRNEEPAAVTRAVPAAAPLRGALEALLAGPTDAERRDGVHSWFSAETASMLRGVSIDDAGRATVDFDDFSGVIANASTSAGSMMLLGELNRTIFQFPEIAEIEYRFDGDCHAFWNWLQRDCQPVRRGERDA